MGIGDIRSSLSITYIRPFNNGPGLAQKTRQTKACLSTSEHFFRYLVNILVVVSVTIIQTDMLISLNYNFQICNPDSIYIWQ